jgi:hypothetical protein
MSDISAWAYLWSNLERYALLRTKSSRLLVVDTDAKTAIVIEDDNLVEEVVARMVDAGARILERFP